MKRIALLVPFLLFGAAAQAEPTPASGELTDTSGPLQFAGGPFVVPNPSSDSIYLGGTEPADTPVICNSSLMNCDVYALSVSVPDAYRNSEAASNSVARVVINFSAMQADTINLTTFEAYLYDADETELARSDDDFAGTDHSTGFELPLSALPNGHYQLRVTANRGLGGSYTAEVTLVQPTSTRSSKGALRAVGALTPMLLLVLTFAGLTGLVRR